jgi:hypothetical protein
LSPVLASALCASRGCPSPARGDYYLDSDIAITSLGDRLVHTTLVVPAIAGEAPQRHIDLAQQGRDNVRVVHRVLGEHFRDDLAVAVHADVALPPTTPLARLPVLTGAPLAGPVELQAGGVHDQVVRPVVPTKPSVCRRGRWKTVRRVKPLRMAWFE